MMTTEAEVSIAVRPVLHAHCAQCLCQSVAGRRAATHLRRLDVKAVSSAIRQAIAASHNLQVYSALLVKPGSIPKTSSGKIQRRACQHKFLEGDLNIVGQWRQEQVEQTDVTDLAGQFFSD